MSFKLSHGWIWGLAVLVAVLGTAGGVSAYEWFTWSGNGHSYAAIDVAADVATQAALADAEGAYLVTINSWEENLFLYWTFNAKAENFWTGGSRNAAGEWQWVTGETFDFTNWNYEPWADGRDNLYLRSVDATWGNWLETRPMKALMELEAPADTTPPALTLNPPSPARLAPPYNRPVLVTVSGTVQDAESGVARAWLEVQDEYGGYNDVVPLTGDLATDGTFVVSFEVDAKPAPRDRDGRLFVLTLFAEDQAGNVALVSEELVSSPRRRGRQK